MSTTPKFDACTVCHAIENFDQLIDELDAAIGENWGDLPFASLPKFLEHDAARDLKFLLFAVSADDDVAQVCDALSAASDAQVATIVATNNIPQAAFNELVRNGGDEYIDYPLAPGTLGQAIAALTENEPAPTATVGGVIEASPEPRPSAPEEPQAPQTADAIQESVENNTPEQETLEEGEPQLAALTQEHAAAELEPSLEPEVPEEVATPETQEAQPTPAQPLVTLPQSSGQGTVFATQGLSGGSGASTLAVNLAYELATISKTDETSVCLLDFDFQFGSVAGALDLPQKTAIIETLSDTSVMDESSFAQALQKVSDSLFVFTAPGDLIPLDFVNSEDIQNIIDIARAKFDYVVIDMPHTITDWTQTAIESSQLFFAVLENDLRSAQNCVRFRNALSAAGVGTSSLRYVLNHAPKFTDLNGKSRVKRMCESLDISIEFQMPEGGKAVTFAADQGEPLAVAQPKNPLRKEIRKLADEIHKLRVSA